MFNLANLIKTSDTMKTVFLLVAIVAGAVVDSSLGRIDKTKLGIELKTLLAAIEDDSSSRESDEGDFPVQPIKQHALEEAISSSRYHPRVASEG